MSTSSPEASKSEDIYKSSSFIGHSLWMVPKNGSASYTAYSKLVADMSSELGTFQFIPHITLVAAMLKGEEDVLTRTKALAKELAPYKFEFDNISYRDAYFQCVYAQMKPTKEVLQANNLARQYFPERQSDAAYKPHLSLIYGDFSEHKKQQDIIPKLHNAMKDHHHDNNDDAIAVIPVDAIEIWSTQGDVKDWYKVARIPLTGGGGEKRKVK